MSIAVDQERLAQVPALIAHPGGRLAPLPTVLWFHGFGADKGLHLPELCRFAEAGLLAVGIDAVGHGQRQFADFDQQFSRGSTESLQLFNSFVSNTVAELPLVIDTLVARGLSDPERLAVAGVSMGAAIVYGAIATDRRLRAAVALLGSPGELGPDSPRLAIEHFFPTALLSIVAGQDTVVPPIAARTLHQRLAACYRVHPDRLSYREIAGAAHFMLPEQWDDAVAQAREWLVRFLL